MRGCRPLLDGEIAQVLEELAKTRHPLRNQALFHLGLRTGFRISELLSLKVSDVFQNGHYTDRVSVERKNMKKKIAGRTVMLHPEAGKAIQAWVSELVATGRGAPSQFLFESLKGRNKPLNRRSAWEMLCHAYAKCGLTGKLGTHGMRKTFARKVYDKLGHDLIRTQKAMGHKSVDSTVSYLSFAETEIDDAILKS
jgi:site-specific recombinase XerD